jgi:DNA-binding NarL/FixJ family response regulator
LSQPSSRARIRLRDVESEFASGATILVIDDDERLRGLICDMLANAGYQVVPAVNGEEGIAAMRNRPPNLVISDIQMPGRSGYEVCRAVRAEFGDIPFMFLSGTRTEPYDRVAGFEFGADDYITKPFDPDEFLARVRALLRRSARADAAATAPALDTSGDLTPRELEILQLLAEGLVQGEIASRLSITQKTVAKHIERVLKKLDVHSRTEAVAQAYRRGLIAQPEKTSAF